LSLESPSPSDCKIKKEKKKKEKNELASQVHGTNPSAPSLPNNKLTGEIKNDSPSKKERKTKIEK
jgi:hypothetical protein